MNTNDSLDVVPPNTYEIMKLQDNQKKLDEQQKKFAKLVEIIMRKNGKD